MDPFTIAALVATLAGSAMQYKASQDAQSRQNAAIRESLARQKDLQMQAEQKALGAAKEFAPADRKTEQAQIADQITQELSAPVSESQAIRNQQSTTQGNVSNDYTTAKAASELNSLKSAQQLAALLGKTTASSRLRMNEGIRLMDTGQSIDQLNSFSRGNQAADQIAIDVAGRPSAGLTFAGSALSGIGRAALMGGGDAGSLTGAGTAAKYGTDIGSQQTAMLSAQDAGMGGNSWASAFNKLFK